MNKQTQLELLTRMNDELISISKSKGADYADVDVLSNFKSVSAAVKALKIDTKTPVGYALLMVVLKIARLGNLLEKGEAPQNESVEDSFKDGVNYFKLAYLTYIDTNDNSGLDSKEQTSSNVQ